MGINGLRRAALAFFGIFCLWAAEAEVKEQIVVQVNSDIITLTQYNREKDALYQALGTRFSGAELKKQFQEASRNIISALVDELLLMQKAKEYNFTEDLDLEARSYIDDLMKQNNIPTLEALKQEMARAGVNYNDYLENMKRQILSNRIKGAVVRQKVKILTTDLEEYYRAHPDEFTVPEKVDLEEIVAYTKDKKADEVRARMEEAVGKLKSGADFHAVAKVYSDGPTAAKGGAIGSFDAPSLSASMTAALKDLNDGQFSGLLQTDFGFQIVRLVSRTPAKLRPFGELKPEIEDKIFKSRLEPVLVDYLRECRAEAYIFVTPEFQSEYQPDIGTPAPKAEVEKAPVEDKKKKKKKSS